MEKQPDGSHRAILSLDPRRCHVKFKFLKDGEWLCSEDYSTELDNEVRYNCTLESSITLKDTWLQQKLTRNIRDLII